MTLTGRAMNFPVYISSRQTHLRVSIQVYMFQIEKYIQTYLSRSIFKSRPAKYFIKIYGLEL